MTTGNEDALTKGPACTICPLHTTVKNVKMKGVGNPESGLFIVLERPNVKEDSTGYSFVGSGAALLQELMSKAGILPDAAYLTYLSKCALYDEANKELKKESIDKCVPAHLKAEILQYKPKVVIACGAEVMSALCGKVGINKNRGTFNVGKFDDFEFKVMPTFSPYFLFKNREKEPVVIQDLKRATLAINRGENCWHEDKLGQLDYRLVTDMEDFDTLMQEIRDAGLVAVDIESRLNNPYRKVYSTKGFPLVSIQFSTKEKAAWFLPIAHVMYQSETNPDGWAWEKSVMTYIKDRLASVLENPSIFVIGHNFKFDSKWIYQWLGIKPLLSFDTMLAHGLFEETSSSLKKVAWQLTDLGGYEEKQATYTDSLETDKKYDMFHYPMDDLFIYGCCDTDVTFRIFKIMDEKLRNAPKLLNLFKTLIRASRAFLDIESQGILVDHEQLAKLGVELELEIRRYEEEIKMLADPQIKEMNAELQAAAIGKSGKQLKNKPTEFNIASPEDISKLFYEKLGIPINDRFRSRKTKDPSVGKNALEELKNEYPIAGKLLEWRKISKQKAAFVDSYPRFMDENHHIHPDYKLIKFYNEDSAKDVGADTGRLSCSDPNLQQVPARDETKRIKKLFLPDCDSHLLVDFDYSCIELRVTAMYAKDESMVKFFNQGSGDFHRFVASKINGIPEDRVTKLQRTYAKATTFGILYGAGPQKIAQTANMSEPEALKFIKEYFSIFPGLKKWIANQKAFAIKHGYVLSMFGRKRSLPDAKASRDYVREAALRRAVNSPIQSDASDITLYGLTRIFAYLRKFDHADSAHPSALRGSVHDSILLSVHNDNLGDIIEHIKFNILESPNLDFIIESGVQLQAEVSVGPTWGDQTEVPFD